MRQLQHIADIRTGINLNRGDAREHLSPDGCINNPIPVVSVAQHQSGHILAPSKATFTQFFPRSVVNDRYLVHPGDLIFNPYQGGVGAMLIGADMMAVVAHPLKIIHPTSAVDPEFLLWVLNSDLAKRFYHARVRGTSITTIPTGSINEIPIPDMDKDTQHTITDLITLSRREEKLSNQIQSMRNRMVNHHIKTLCNNAA